MSTMLAAPPAAPSRHPGAGAQGVQDADFEKKLVDAVGLYMSPPKWALVFSFDEKTQVQALDRTQPSLPLKPGRAGTMTHEYKRNGTADLFAAMNVGTGEVLYNCQKGHKATDVLRFFKLVDLHVPKTSISTSCSTTSRPTRRHRLPTGSPIPSVPAGICTSLRRRRLGATSSSGGSSRSPSGGSVVECSTPWRSSPKRSSCGPSIGTTTPSPLSGTSPPGRSSRKCVGDVPH
jgi:hypothetical protein